MRNIIGLVVGFYLTVALVVFASAAWSFSTDPRWKNASCGASGGAPDWMSWAAYRAVAWPRTYFDDAEKIPPNDLVAWLTVQYNPWPDTCR